MKSSPFLQKTNVYIFINVKDDEYQKFIIGSEAKSETFCVTNTTITLIPEIIPGAENIFTRWYISNGHLSVTKCKLNNNMVII